MGSLPTATDTPPERLAAGVVHDLRNVLFVIRTHAEHLLDTLDPTDPRSADAHAIVDTAQRGVALARQALRDVSEGAGAAHPVDASDVIRRMLPLLTRLAGTRVAVSTTLAADLWPVAATAVQIEQIVMNLVTNARDAMPEGGELHICTGNQPADARHPGDMVAISVADSGEGVDPALQERIFEPFFTTRTAEGGTGVGLATVRTIARTQGGDVDVSSVPGRGATFRVLLPRSVPVPPAPGGTLHGARVLLIENERAIREYLQRSLVAEGMDVLAGGSGHEALALCAGAGTPVDVVVTDVHLPDIQGPDVARRVKERWPDARVIYMSGGLDAIERLSGTAVPVLAKPFTTSELLAALRAALTGPQAG